MLERLSAVTLSAQSPPDARPEAPEPDREASSPIAFIAVIGVATLVVVLCGLGATMSGLFDFAKGSTAPAAAATSVAASDAGARVPKAAFADGQWLVGGDIQPGTYSVTVVAGSPGCTWERNASTDGTATSVLESGNGTESEAIVVDIKDTDKVFQSKNCGTWRRTSD
jgi:hypothetical protein